VLGEVVEGARVRARAEQLQRLVRERRVHLVPALHLRVRRPDLLQLVDREAVRPVVLLVDDDAQRVIAHQELAVGDVVLLADGDLVVLDLPGRVGDVGLTRAELLESTAGAGRADRDVGLRVLLHEQLRGRGGQRLDRARPVDRDRARDGLALAATTTAAVVRSAAGGQGQSDCHDSGDGRGACPR
jgi:hypothetical protein